MRLTYAGRVPADLDTDRAWLDRLRPRYRYGVILPGVGGVQRGADYQFYRLVPTDVLQVGVGLGIRDYSAASVDVAMNAFWQCVDTLAAEEVDCLVLSGVPVSAGLGRGRIASLRADVLARTGKPLYATLEAIIHALHHLGCRRIAMGSRFPADANAAIGAYLADGGIEVIGQTARELSLADARRLTLEDGMRLTLEVGREAARQAPAADAVLLPGGAALSLHAIPALEAEFGKPVLTNLSAEIWDALVRPGIIPAVTGWGRLLAGGQT
jgi:maleate cis-trans isomerase